MIELLNVTKRYGDTSVLKKVNLKINEPGIYCLLGRNGAGKTTLLKSIAGYQNISEGKISVDGKTVSTAVMDTGVSYIENFARHFNLSVGKLLNILARVNPDYDREFAAAMMGRFEFDGRKNLTVYCLERKRWSPQ